MLKATRFSVFAAVLLAAIAAHAQGVWTEGGLPVQTMSVENGTQFYCRVMAYHYDLANLAPGESIFNGHDRKPAKKPHGFGKIIGIQVHRGDGVGWYTGSSNIDLPLVALCYADEAHRKYVGAAARVFNIPGAGQSSNFQWTIQSTEVQVTDNAPKASDTTTPHFVSHGVKFPRVTSEGEGIQMIVWNSPTAAHLTVNGNDQGYLHQGETYYLGARSPAAITLTTKDANGRLTTWSQTFMNQDYYGVHAEVLILGTQDLH